MYSLNQGKTFLHLADKAVTVCLSAGHFNFCVRSIRTGMADILPHCIIKQEHILVHHRNLV